MGRVYDEKSKKWLSGNVEALGADGVVYVKSKDKVELVNVRPFEGKICRFIPDVKERKETMSIQISVESKVLEDKVGKKVRLTFDKWTTGGGPPGETFDSEEIAKINNLL